MAQKTPFIDHYAALEIQPNASADEVKETWRQLTRQLQPKSNSGDPVATERLQEIHEAYTVLSDPRERIKYDRKYEQHRRQLKHEKQRIDHYAVLEIQFGASDVEIRRAWMQLVKQWQSKANSGDPVATERLQEIHEAYTVLSDPRERIKYDRKYEQHRPQLDEQARRERYEREREKPELLKMLKFEEEWLKLEQEEQSEKEQEETDRERHEHLKQIIFYLTIVVLIIAGVVGVGALIWFA